TARASSGVNCSIGLPPLEFKPSRNSAMRRSTLGLTMLVAVAVIGLSPWPVSGGVAVRAAAVAQIVAMSRRDEAVIAFSRGEFIATGSVERPLATIERRSVVRRY